MDTRRVWTGAKWHEEKVLTYLEHRLPNDYVFLNNRVLKGPSNNATGTDDFREYDLILLGKYAVYVVEIKHIMGNVISGNSQEWSWESGSYQAGTYKIPSPIKQVREQKLKLIEKIKESGVRVAVTDCVCILSDQKPKIEVMDDAENLRKIFWYQELDKFLTDPQQIPAPVREMFRVSTATDITSYHERLAKLIDSNFTSRVLDIVEGYEIVDDAWVNRRYKAYYARRKDESSQKAVLKIYTVPEDIASPKEVDRFIQKLNGHDFDVLRQLQHGDKKATGGREYVLGIRDAFLYPYNKSKKSYVVISDWVDGKPLSQLLDHVSPYASRYLIAAQICRGMAFLHSARVAHRHLSLDSLIWSRDESKVKITNFDFAKFTGTKNVSVYPPEVAREIEAEMKEHKKYLAPEILKIDNNQIDADPSILYHQANEFTDLYSIGVILLELFTAPIHQPDTVKRRLKQAQLSSNIREILVSLCSDVPPDRKTVSLVKIAETFEQLFNGETNGLGKSRELADLQPNSYLNSYQIVRKIPPTEMSEIYLARDTVMDFKVVIKIPRTGGSNDILAELRNGKQISDEIKDKNCAAQLLTYSAVYVSNGKIDAQPSTNSKRVFYQVWEYIEGDDLGVYLKKNTTSLPEQLELCRKSLVALSALHERKWMHGDIKPQNFMRTPQGDVKIIDFGLSRRISEKSTGGGTPGYLPPEPEPTVTGDVWAMGRLMLVILFGVKYEPTLLNPELEVDWDDTEAKLGIDFTQVFRTALQTEPEKRYPSALEFIDEFDTAYQKWQNRDQGKATMNYNNVLAKLKKEREEADSSGDLGAVDASNKDIRALEKWMADGQKGDCPVDLSIYGVTQADLILSSVTETVETPKAEAPRNGTPETVDVESVAVDEADQVQKNLRNELEKVRQHITNKEWREAVALARQIEGLAKGEVKGTASDLLSQAQVQLNKELEKVLAKGDAARAKNNNEKAREYYRSALDLDTSNSHARLALQELDGLVKDKVSKEQQDSLRAGLSERRDIRRLGEAVYDAEALNAEGKLPAKLMVSLKEAREYYDKTRRIMGEETTAMRYGDIALRADAVAKIQARVASGARTIYDQTTDTDKPAFDVLREAQELLRQSSEDTAQYGINIAEKFKTSRPRYIHQRLTEVLGKPLQEQEKRKLEEKLAEVDHFIQAQEKSESLQTQAMQETDPVRKLEILLQASQTFGSIPGLQEQIVQARPVAIAMTQTVINDALQSAELFIRNQEYSEARTATNEAETQSAKWPEPQAPEEISRLLEEVRTLRGRIDAIENAWKEYSRLAQDIRKKVIDQSERAAGLALFKQVSEDVRYQGFSDLRVLISEIDQYKDAGEQLNDANAARDKGDWSRVFDIADKVSKAGMAGPLAPRFQELHDDAITELNIQRAQELLESDEVPEANNILSSTLNREQDRSPEREKNLRNRLNRELEHVQQAIRGNKPMQELYDAACDLLNQRDSVPFRALTSPSFALRQSRVGADGEVNSPEMRTLVNRLKDSSKEADPTPQELTERVAKVLLIEFNRKGMKERLDALRLFRYVGGDKTQVPQDGWPAYALSLRTAEARRAARLVSESLRADIFQPLVQRYADYQGNENELKDDELHGMAEQAGALREAYLLETENERAVGRWAEVEWGKRLAYQEEKRSNWQRAISIWKELDNHYPGFQTVKRGLQNARIQDTIIRASYMVRNDHKGAEAVSLLKDLQAEPDMGNSWELNLALAETYETLGEFDSAFGNIDQIERVIGGLDTEQQKDIRTQVEQKRIALESEQVVYTRSADARNKMIAGNPIEALRVVQSGIDDPKVTDLTSLQNLRDDIFNEASQELLNRAKVEQDKGSDEGKIQAVTALVDLQTLEDLVEQPMGKRRSTTGLNRLRADLASVAKSVIRAAGEFEPGTMPLEQAIGTASSISARLQTFDNVTSVFNAELESVRDDLTKRRREIAMILGNLQSLEKTLKDAGNQGLWESAILTGDFEVLKQYLARINRLELNEMKEVRAFDKRHSETQESYQYLMGVMGQIRQKFSVGEDFGFVKNEIVRNKVQPPYRENNQAWQMVHAKEYEYIRSLLNDRVRVPDVYGRGDLVGWEKVLEQAEEREKELELWQDWEKKCAQNMDAAERAVKVAETQPADMPTRNKKMDWEKALETVRKAISVLTYPQEEKFTDLSDRQEKTRTVFVVGVRDIRDVPVPVRSKAVKNLEEEGKRRKSIADQWAQVAETQIEALQAILDKRGFPSAEEFNNAVKQSDWDRLGKLLVRAREAGITNENERKQVDTFARVLQQKRQEQQKKGFKLW